jgi:hypothetical protein
MTALLQLGSASLANEASLKQHPAADSLARVFAAQHDAKAFAASNVTRADYLKLIAGNVDHWKTCQNPEGAIIDPFSNGERQYSTPAFALAAAALVAEADRKDLLEPAVRAMTFATRALRTGKAADSHPDFYIPLLIHARRYLKPHVDAKTLANWDADLRAIEPEKVYRMDLKGMNWNLVSSSGELLRRQDGLVDAAKSDAQLAYLEERIAHHLKEFSRVGLYADPGVPMAYDAFSRLWLDDVMANGAYAGASRDVLDDMLTRGALSSLLLLSPSGEWASGGRSSHHNWGEAEIIAICEMHAARWKKLGRDDIAGAFKRAAHVALQSMQRWQRPTGELWIIKNRFEPDTRFAYERYSNHSQYNLLPMAMLAIAYSHADESIAEKPMPSEIGGYVFDVRETFHKVAAAAGGYYVLIDTAGDPHYNATGLQRVHRSGVAFPPFNDTASDDRAYGDKDGPRQTLAPDIQVRDGNAWHSLGDARLVDAKKPDAPSTVKDVSLRVDETSPKQVRFSIEWNVLPPALPTREQYTINADGVEVTHRLMKDANGSKRVGLPVTMFDGVEESKVTLKAKSATVEHRNSVLVWTITSPAQDVQLDPQRVPAHTGLLQQLSAELPASEQSVTWRLALEQK